MGQSRQYDGVDHLFGQILSNAAFEGTVDETLISWFMGELSYWSADMRDLRLKQQKLEATSIFFAEKYSKVYRSCKTKYNLHKFQTISRLRIPIAKGGLGLKGDALNAALYEDETYILLRDNRSAAKELEGIFDKLYWAVVRKHERIQEQQTQNARTGG